jgi:hypothetical protein
MKSFTDCFFDFICSEEGFTREDLINDLREGKIDFDALERRATETVSEALRILRKKSGR